MLFTKDLKAALKSSVVPSKRPKTKGELIRQTDWCCSMHMELEWQFVACLKNKCVDFALRSISK